MKPVGLGVCVCEWCVVFSARMMLKESAVGVCVCECVCEWCVVFSGRMMLKESAVGVGE